MTRFVWACGLMLSALVGCGSDVHLCAGGAVCGSDGRTYTDRCAALSADVQVASLGACAVECSPVECALACELGFRAGSDGCPICVCADCASPSDCPGSTACVGGVCMETPDAGVDPEDGGIVVSCPPGQELCGDGCADLTTDLRHCGGCFEACANEGPHPGTTLCSDGECTITCPDGTEDCNGDPRDGCEVDLATDEDDCGACGNPCDSDKLCLEGGCVAAGIACSDPANWVVEEEAPGVCQASCAGSEVRLEGLAGSCGIFSRACTLVNALGTCQERAARCCFPD
ncbi:MAG: hypothetical protein H6722_00865 [Sandaracinus sp.]|nr:hypothetical protein [Myxococcales bacterium]MCB9610995.1 hypothetical protein [Sandaracinus sp.]